MCIMCTLYRILNRKAKKTGGTDFLDHFRFILLDIVLWSSYDRVVVPFVVGFGCLLVQQNWLYRTLKMSKCLNRLENL